MISKNEYAILSRKIDSLDKKLSRTPSYQKVTRPGDRTAGLMSPNAVWEMIRLYSGSIAVSRNPRSVGITVIGTELPVAPVDGGGVGETPETSSPAFTVLGASDVVADGILDGYSLFYDITVGKFRVEPPSSGSSPLTTKGDLFAYAAADARLAVGATDGWVLSVDSSTSTGLKWVALAGGGDMLLGTSQVVTASKTFNNGTLLLDDSDSSYNLILASTSTITAANKTLTFDVNNADRTLTVAANATVSGTNTGDQTISLTGDVTGSGTGTFAATIAADSVTMDKIVDIATDTFLGRVTAATGTVEVLTNAQAKTSLDLTGTNSGDQTSIVGITGTKAQFNTANTEGSFMYVGDAPTSHTLLSHTISGETLGHVLVADSATTYSIRQLLGSEISNDQSWTSNVGTVTSVSGGTAITSTGGSTPSLSLDNTAVTAAAYTNADITVDAQGRITAASSGSGVSQTPWTANIDADNFYIYNIPTIRDANQNEILAFASVASAVNHLQVSNATTAAPTVSLEAVGDSADVNISLISKGDSDIHFEQNSVEAYRFSSRGNLLIKDSLGSTTTNTGFLTMRFSSTIPAETLEFINAGNSQQFNVEMASSRITLTPENTDSDFILLANGTGIIKFEQTSAIKLTTGTTAQRPSTAQAGMMRYNSTLDALEYANNALAWNAFSGGSSAGGNTEVQTSDGSGGFVASNLFFDEITGNMTLGDSSLSGSTRTIQPAGSAGNVILQLKALGTSSVLVAAPFEVANATPALFRVSAATDVVRTGLEISQENSGGVGGVGLGVALDFLIESSAGLVPQSARIYTKWSDATTTSEDADYFIEVMENGSLSEKLKIASSGLVTFNSNAGGGSTGSFLRADGGWNTLFDGATYQSSVDPTAHAILIDDGGSNEYTLIENLGFATKHASVVKPITIKSPTSSEDITMFFTDVPITISQVNDVVRGATQSITYNIVHGSDRSSVGTNLWTTDRTTTSVSGSETTIFNNASVSAGSWVWFESQAVGAATDEASISVEYTIDITL